ncbi:MAG: hypothetical protein QW687_05095 [Candidatus Hadarchaeales archaeon]
MCPQCRLRWNEYIAEFTEGLMKSWLSLTDEREELLGLHKRMKKKGDLKLLGLSEKDVREELKVIEEEMRKLKMLERKTYRMVEKLLTEPDTVVERNKVWDTGGGGWIEGLFVRRRCSHCGRLYWDIESSP